MRNRWKIIVGISLAFILGALAADIFGAVLSLVQTSRTVSNVGSVRGIGVGIYWDLAFTNRTSSIDWGILEPGSSKAVTVYVRNEGSTGATLSQTTENWNPSAASSHMTLNWNYAGQTLNVNQVLPIRLTLVVSSSITGITNFSFDIIITSTG